MNRPHVQRAAALQRKNVENGRKFVERGMSRKDTSHKLNCEKGIIIAGHARKGMRNTAAPLAQVSRYCAEI